jgi:hypothetical protein
MQTGDWTTRSVFDRYNVVSERDSIDAAFRLDQHLSDVQTKRDKANFEATFERCREKMLVVVF